MSKRQLSGRVGAKAMKLTGGGSALFSGASVARVASRYVPWRPDGYTNGYIRPLTGRRVPLSCWENWRRRPD